MKQPRQSVALLASYMDTRWVSDTLVQPGRQDCLQWGCALQFTDG